MSMGNVKSKECEMCGSREDIVEPNPEKYPGVYFCNTCNDALNKVQAEFVKKHYEQSSIRLDRQV